ncbi:MAG: hypothetical protein KGH72_02675 [Candidatus Micrarchaeota archaeon]|nr:hypothetical protein [Candidatus Micrarchaeota archaeon]
MRNTFSRELLKIIAEEQGRNESRTWLMSGDLGFSAFEAIRETGRFINAGISEQNMIGVASGMAKEGKNVFVYSIIPFLLYRTFEQIRNDVCYPNLPVRLVGTGAGLSYSDAGATHHPLEDLKVADSLPSMTVLSPSDPKEVEAFMRLLKGVKGPIYLRLARNGDPVLHDRHGSMAIGKALRLVKGSKVLIVSTGIVTKTALEVAGMLNSEDDGIAEVIEIHTFKPFDSEAVRSAAKGKDIVATIEDNTGALENKVAVSIAGLQEQKFISFKLPDQFTHISGTKEYLFEAYGMGPRDVFNRIKGLLDE